MRKLNFFMAMVAFMSMALVMSCESDGDDPKDDGGTIATAPVLDEDFSFTVNGNSIDFTTTLSGNVWVTINEGDHTFADGKVSVFLSNAGTYASTVSTLVDGEVFTSEPFNVEIAQDDKSFLNEEPWLSLSGGADKTKTWKLDINSDGEVYWFNGPISFSGYSADNVKKEEWSYWAWDVLPEELPYTVNGAEQTSFFNWEPGYDGIIAPNDYGTVTFDGTEGKVSVIQFGETTSGSFSFDPETMKLTLSGDVVLPIDTARLNEPQFTDEHLMELRIFTLSDSAMQIGIRRTYDGFKDGGHPVDPWVIVYNFIVDGYTYPVPVAEEFTYSEPLNTSISSSDLVGTWKLGGAPINWIGWDGVGDQGTIIDAGALNEWPDRAAFEADWFGATAEQMTAVDALEHEFKDDGSCTIGGISTTYSVSGGVLTFADSVGLVAFDGHWFGAIGGTTFSILDVEAPEAGGLWVGVQDGDANQSKGAQIVKQ